MLLYSVVMIVLAGSSVVSWLGYIGHVQRNAARSQARMHAMYAAEAGIEQIVDYCNNPLNYQGDVPTEYTSALQTSPYYVGGHTIHPEPYALFEPYITKVLTNDQGVPTDLEGNVIVDDSGNLRDGEDPVVLGWTYLTDPTDPYSSKIPTFEVDLTDNTNLVFRDENGNETARVTRLTFINPKDFRSFGENLPPSTDPIIGKVVAMAVTPRGPDVVVECILGDNNTIDLRADGAIISSASTDFNGQFNVHWGDVWAKGNIDLPNGWNNSGEGHIPTQSEDPWVRIKSRGVLMDSHGSEHANGAEEDGYSENPLASGDPNYHVPYLGSELARNDEGESDFEDYENLLQHQDLEFPRYDYLAWKEFFLVNQLPYYWTGADGLVYGIDEDERSRTYGEVIGQEFDDWFDTDPSDPDYWNIEDQLVFIDTIPTDDEGNAISDPATAPLDHRYKSRAPADDGSNLATVVAAGQGTHTRGLMFTVAHVDFRGQGNPPTVGEIDDPDGNAYVIRPDGTVPSGRDARFKINHNGIFFAWGTVTNTGNRTFYGSIFTRMGFLGSGSREVYYNVRLRDGSWLNLNQSFVRRMYWQIRKNDLPELS